MAVVALALVGVLLSIGAPDLCAQDAAAAPDARGQEAPAEPLHCTGEEEASSAGATLADFAWMAGTWRGEVPRAGTAEVHYMPPAAGVLPSVFRLRTEERTILLEAITLVEDERGLTLYARHFSPALEPLEEAHAIELRFTERRGDCFLFENVREENPRRSLIRRLGAEAFLGWSELWREDGGRDEIRVEYRRVRP